MAKKKRRLRSCQNNGGLGIPPCESSCPDMVMKLRVDAAFLCADSPIIYLCHDCMELLTEHARMFDVGVEIVDDS
jgi:hypothetical protein